MQHNHRHFKLSSLICLTFVIVTTSLLIDVTNAQCKEPRIRRPWRNISQAERELFLEATLTLKQNGVYDQFIAIHKCHRNAFFSHGTSVFLPWHRWYLWQYENMLRAISPRFQCITVPYWDWERDAGKEAKSPVFGSLLGHIKPQNSSNCVNDGLFSTQNGWIVDGRCLKRQYDPKIAFIGEIALTAILSEPRYGNMDSGFRVNLETRAHGAPHAWLNGDMGDFTSPNDPMFFLHHSNIDRLWSVWQDCHEYDKVSMKNLESNQPYPFYEGSHDQTDVLEPMPYMYLNGKTEDYFKIPGKSAFPSPRDVMHIHNNQFTGMHYTYDPADNLVAIMTKLNPGFCTWDWFLEPPTLNSTNKLWGVNWFKNLTPSRGKTIVRRPALRSLKAVDDEAQEFQSMKRQALQGWDNSAKINDVYSLMWTTNSTHARFRVQTTTSGWIAIGFKPDDGGSMSDCDMVIMRSLQGSVSVSDYWSAGYKSPTLDAVQSLTDASGGIADFGAWMEFTRPLDANGDSQDTSIVPGDMRVVWAYGKTTSFRKHDSSSRGYTTLVLVPKAQTQPQVDSTPVTTPDPTPVATPDPTPVTTPEAPVAEPVQEETQIDSAALLKVSGAAQFSPEYRLAWKIERKYVVFTITLKTTSPVGWVALGFQPIDRGMTNADVYISKLDEESPVVRDYSSFGYFAPVQDTGLGSIDNVLLSSVEVKSGVIKVVFTRWLDTGDQDTDRPIVPGKMDVIWAYGPKGYKKHAVGARGVTTLDFFSSNTQACPSRCITTNGRCNNGTCECFLGWTGDSCQIAAAWPNIPIEQISSAKLNTSLARIQTRNRAQPIFKDRNVPGARNIHKYMYDMLSRAYDVLSNPRVGLPSVQRLMEGVLNQKISKNISLTDKLTMVLLGECALTAGSGKQYVSDDWLDKMGSKRNPLWDPPCPTGTCCKTSTMVSFRQLCKGGGVAAPTCNPKTCRWEYSCKVKEDFKFGSPIAVPSFVKHSKAVPKKNMVLLSRLARRINQNRIATTPLSTTTTQNGKPSRFLVPDNVQSASLLSSNTNSQTNSGSYPMWLWAFLALGVIVFVVMLSIISMSLKSYLQKS